MIKGLQVGEYRGNKNFSLRKNHQIRVLKQHHYRKYIKDLDGMSFDHPLGQQQSGQTTLSNFLELQLAVDQAGNNSVWAECICYFSNISTNSTNFYLSCPHCKKKVA